MLLAERLDAVALIYHVASLAPSHPHQKPVRMDYYWQGPYDRTLTLSGVTPLES